MYYLANLALPAIVALLVAANDAPEELSVAWIQSKADTLPSLYMLFALPHWIWAGISSLFAATKGSILGGFLGLHLLLLLVWLLVSQSTETHAANGWFLYLLGAPAFMAMGALTGRFLATRNLKAAAELNVRRH